MSHEIRTPISGIIGLSELLYDSLISKEQTELVLDVRTSAQFLLALVNDILDLSKIDSGQLNIECIPFSPREMIRDTLVPLQFQAKEKGLDLRWTYDVGPPTTFLGDPHRIRQVLTNLIGNCIKFTPKGFVDLNVSVAHHVDGEILDVKFVVQDTGIGIAEEARALLFKPFSQADSSTARMYGGTGLGLSICLELVELMGGHMSLQSTLGKGTTVTFNVPFKFHHTPSSEIRPSLLSNSQNQLGETSELITTVYRVRRTSVQKAPCKGEDSQGLDSEILVLIVDDNVINLKVNSHLIERSGYKVATACNGQEAWEYLCKTSTQPRPDMVFMDCMMPVVDGFEATRRIRHDADMFDEQIRTLPIVALTASALHSDKEKCWEVGMDDYIGRPVSRNALKDAVVRWTSTKNA
jgi:CheY-like chemotaxis protein